MRKTVLVRPCQRIVRDLAHGSQFSLFFASIAHSFGGVDFVSDSVQKIGWGLSHFKQLEGAS